MPSIESRIQGDLIRRFLIRVPLFSDIAPNDMAQLAQACKLNELEKGQLVYTKGDASECALVVMSGQIDSIWQDKSGREVIFRTYVKGDILGLHDIADDLPRSATCACAARSNVIHVPRIWCRKLAESSAMQRKLAQSARHEMRRMEEAHRRTALFDLETRLAHYLRDLAQDDTPPRVVIIEDSQHRIASKVQASRTRVNTTFKKWRERGEISLRDGRVEVHQTEIFWRQYDTDDR